MKKILNILLLLFVSEFCLMGQNSPQLRSYHDLKLFTECLIQGKENDFEKARVIYEWITDNIAYDIKAFNKGYRVDDVKCKKKESCDEKKKQHDIQTVENALRNRKAICGGYSLLFKTMCDYANVRSYVIHGYIRKNSKHAGNMGVMNHAWNAIEVGRQTYYLDVTWAAGSCDEDEKGKLISFNKLRNDFYWLTPVEKLTMDHYPRYPRKIPNFYIDREVYRDQPYVNAGLIPFIEICNPQKGIIKTELNDTIRFQLEYQYPIKKLYIFTNLHKIEKKKEKKAEKKTKMLECIPFSYKNGVYEFEVVAGKSHLRYIEIYFDKEISLKYLVKVAE